MTDQIKPDQIKPDDSATNEPAVTPGAKSGEPTFGWNDYAERMNGRFAMVGFMVLLALEWFTQQDFFTWLGLR